MNRESIIEEIKHEFRAARHVTDEAEVCHLDALMHTTPSRLLRCNGFLHHLQKP
jgi:hypothetical protein